MSKPDIIIKTNYLPDLKETRRKGIRECCLLTETDSPHQNIVYIEADEGAEVEYHKVLNSETLYIIKGTFDVILADSTKKLHPKDICYFRPESFHGLRCTGGPGAYLIIFAPSKTEYISEEWLRCLYSEGWKQYIHEDNLGQTRSTLFLGTNAAFFVIFTGLSRALLSKDIPCSFSIKFAVMGFVAIAFGLLGILLTYYWKKVTKAGQLYVRLRHLTLRLIEEKSLLKSVNLAESEYAWREFCKGSRKVKYPLFGQKDASYALGSLRKHSGWSTMLGVIKTLRILWILLLAIGLFLLAGGIGANLYSLR